MPKNKTKQIKLTSMKVRLFLCFTIASFFSITNLTAQDCSGFKTFTIGGWGTNCHGQNPGCYRDATFDLAFPNGLTIGCGENQLVFNSSQAINDFLPSGSTPRALEDGILVNPGRTYKNVLAAQLVGVTLAMGFDEYDEDFSLSSQYFGNLVITEGVFEGMTVYDFLETANSIIGGCSTGYSFSDLNATATAINENFDGGNSDNGFLSCPDIIYTERTASVNIYPNPIASQGTLEFSFKYDSPINIELYNVNGQFLKEIYNGDVKSEKKYRVNMDTNALKPGVYFVKLITNLQANTKTITITN
ncbi:MAG: hypothetical protein CMP76_06050 [Flavobacterium sp.]|nr:hypothetical protein [Flavobacterium sp.]